MDRSVRQSCDRKRGAAAKHTGSRLPRASPLAAPSRLRPSERVRTGTPSPAFAAALVAERPSPALGGPGRFDP